MKKKIVKIVFAVFIILFLIIQIYPVIWLFIASVKPSVELASAPFALPKLVTFENFVKVLSDGKFGTYMWNSLKVTGISLLLIVVLSATAGYALSKFKVKGTKKRTHQWKCPWETSSAAGLEKSAWSIQAR